MALENPGPAWLFCPADRPERFEKAAAAADVVILDLEDGVAAKDRDAARKALLSTPLDPARTVVRVNPSATDDHPLDLEVLARTPYTTVMLAKSTSRVGNTTCSPPLHPTAQPCTSSGSGADSGAGSTTSASTRRARTRPAPSTPRFAARYNIAP